jgi:hypothetical protein
VLFANLILVTFYNNKILYKLKKIKFSSISKNVRLVYIVSFYYFEVTNFQPFLEISGKL